MDIYKTRQHKFFKGKDYFLFVLPFQHQKQYFEHTRQLICMFIYCFNFIINGSLSWEWLQTGFCQESRSHSRYFMLEVNLNREIEASTTIGRPGGKEVEGCHSLSGIRKCRNPCEASPRFSAVSSPQWTTLRKITRNRTAASRKQYLLLLIHLPNLMGLTPTGRV